MARSKHDFKVTFGNLPKTKEEQEMFVNSFQEFNAQRLKYTVDKLNISKEEKIYVAKEIAKLNDNATSNIKYVS